MCSLIRNSSMLAFHGKSKGGTKGHECSFSPKPGQLFVPLGPLTAQVRPTLKLMSTDTLDAELTFSLSYVCQSLQILQSLFIQQISGFQLNLSHERMIHLSFMISIVGPRSYTTLKSLQIPPFICCINLGAIIVQSNNRFA